MGVKVFVGDAVVIGWGILPALSDGSKAPPSVIKGLRRAGVTDGRAIYHSIYQEVAVIDGDSVRRVSPEEIVRESARVGSLCDAVRESFTVVESGGTKYFVPVALVVYSSGWVENFSTAPISVVRGAEPRKWLIPVFVTPTEPYLLREKASRIAEKPTSALLAKECGMSVAPETTEKKEKKQAKAQGGLLLSLMKKRGKHVA